MTPSMRRLLVGVGLVAGLIRPAAGHDWSLAGLSDAVAPLMQGSQVVCTAFGISQPRQLWLTAAHCLGPVVRFHGQPLRVAKVDPQQDLALLVTPTVSSFSALPLARSAPRPGTALLVYGYALCRLQPIPAFTWHAARWTNPNGQQLELFHGQATLCTSGAPILDRARRVVSLHLGHVPHSPYSAGAAHAALVRFAGDLWDPEP